jgi:dienelactone hydrolase
MELGEPAEAEVRRLAIMTSKKTLLKIVSRGPVPVASRNTSAKQQRSGPHRVSGRWLIGAVVLSIAGAALCCWAALCLLFWQGSWQLLYHPTSNITRTPAGIGLAFVPVQFGVTDAGLPQLRGWWIPAVAGAPYSHFTVIFLHGKTGNLSDTIDSLGRLHISGMNVLAFDYRGDGQSQFIRPSEAHWREDADWAIEYLTGTRHINPATIVLDGEGLGANLALETAAAHAELAGVVVNSPLQTPMDAIFNDGRAHLVPAHLLVRDRYDLNAAAAAVRIPVLWFEQESGSGQAAATKEPEAYQRISARKMLVWLDSSEDSGKQRAVALDRWLDELPGR